MFKDDFRRLLSLLLLAGSAALAGCSSSQSASSDPSASANSAVKSSEPQSTYSGHELDNLRRGTANDAWLSSYVPAATNPVVIQNATVMTAAGDEIAGADVVVQNGLIEAIGVDLEVPADATVIDGSGRFLTPGLIDSHSHIGVSATPEVSAHFDNNDSGTTTPQIWIDHSIWPQGPGFSRALAGGTTSALLLPGSGDAIEGRGVPVKMVPARTPQGMIFPDAPHSLKMACGENPKGGGFPSTRMGTVSAQRAAFVRAGAYRDRWDTWLEDPSGDPPSRDLGNETLAEVLRGNILMQVHCYRADDMTSMIQVAQEFDLQIRSFHHAVDAYKIRDMLAERGIAASMWSDWWGFKMEAFDGIDENIALVSEAGAKAVLHSDSDLGIQLLNHDAAKAMWAGRHAGIEVSRDEALKWITLNPAWVLGVDDVVGSIEVGKQADLVLWSGDPFDIYSLADQVWIDGVLQFDRNDRKKQPVSDFDLGILGSEIIGAGEDK